MTVSVEPDTTCSSYSEDTEVAVETDITIKRFRCKQLRAEIDVVAQKELTCEYFLSNFEHFGDCI